MRRIAIVIYYFSISILLFVGSVVIPFQQAEDARIAYTNNYVYEYKRANNLAYADPNSIAIKQIWDAGRALEKTEYKNLSGKFGLLACTVALGLTIFLTFTRPSDSIWIGVFFSVLYAYGSMTTEFYVAIALLVLLTYFIKKRIASRAKRKVPESN